VLLCCSDVVHEVRMGCHMRHAGGCEMVELNVEETRGCSGGCDGSAGLEGRLEWTWR
jgi:hypothetical protein